MNKKESVREDGHKKENKYDSGKEVTKEEKKGNS